MPSGLTPELEKQRDQIANALETIFMADDELLEALEEMIPVEVVKKMVEDDALSDQIFNDLHDAVTGGIKSMATTIVAILGRAKQS